MADINSILNDQRRFFSSGKTRDVSFRIKQLKMLQHAVIENEEKILEALHADLRKSPYEGYLTEVGIVREEIRHIIKRLSKWSRPRRVKTPFYHLPASSYIYPEPYGIALIISPWNYPFQLTVEPLIAAMAAGNCAVVKPSEFSASTTQIIEALLCSCFDPAYICVVTGGAEESKALLAEKFDYIFFTGSPAVGKIVMQAAAKHLTPVTLELGGKSPCIVDNDVNIKLAAKRIVSGKFINAGQTCIAPDYLLVHRSVKEALIEQIKRYIANFYGEQPHTHHAYPKIINQKHFARLTGLLKPGTVLCGGESDPQSLSIAPTLLADVDWSDPVMQAEIFGPILPVMTYEKLSEAIDAVNNRPKPLSLYLFTNNSRNADMVLEQVSFGGGCINDTLIHFATPYLPFGGVGNSGMGSYHGKAGFETFSHHKSVMKNTVRIDFPFRYPPFFSHLKLIKKVLR